MCNTFEKDENNGKDARVVHVAVICYRIDYFHTILEAPKPHVI